MQEDAERKDLEEKEKQKVKMERQEEKAEEEKKIVDELLAKQASVPPVSPPEFRADADLPNVTHTPADPIPTFDEVKSILQNEGNRNTQKPLEEVEDAEEVLEAASEEKKAKKDAETAQ